MKPPSRLPLRPRPPKALPRRPWLQCRRTYFTEEDEADLPQPAWFQSLRAEMLSRKFPLTTGINPPTRPGLQPHVMGPILESIYSSGIPAISGGTGTLAARIQAQFYHGGPLSELLPDGTDTLHSPGSPFVRRMWAGGSLQFHSWEGRECQSVVERLDVRKKLPRAMYGGNAMCFERIRDVELRGDKILVHIERRIRSFSPEKAAKLLAADSAPGHVNRKEGYMAPEWEKVPVVEERSLVFMRAWAEEDLERFRAGQVPDVKYVNVPWTPEFKYSFTPSPALLFRWSALTWNAHAIHLDATFARNVEGHRNILVQGSLTQIILLGFFETHLGSANDRPIIHGIEYRNLAPLYANEEMTICGRLRSTAGDGAQTWDMWILGPTGGMAVRAKIRTAHVPLRLESPLATDPSGTTEEPLTSVQQRRLRAERLGIPIIRTIKSSSPAPLNEAGSPEPAQQQSAPTAPPAAQTENNSTEESVDGPTSRTSHSPGPKSWTTEDEARLLFVVSGARKVENLVPRKIAQRLDIVKKPRSVGKPKSVAPKRVEPKSVAPKSAEHKKVEEPKSVDLVDQLFADKERREGLYTGNVEVQGTKISHVRGKESGALFRIPLKKTRPGFKAAMKRRVRR